MRQNPHVRICGGPGSATTLVYPTVPQHRPRPDRPSRRLLRPQRAGRRPDHVSDPPVSTRPASRRGGHRHHQSRDLGPPPHGHARRPLGLARHRARLPRPAPRKSSPPGLLRAPRIPRRPRPPARPVAGYPRPRCAAYGVSKVQQESTVYFKIPVLDERWTPEFGQLAKVGSRPRRRSLECHGSDGVILLS